MNQTSHTTFINFALHYKLFSCTSIIIVRKNDTETVVAVSIAVSTIEVEHAGTRTIVEIAPTIGPRVSSRREVRVLQFKFYLTSGKTILGYHSFA